MRVNDVMMSEEARASITLANPLILPLVPSEKRGAIDIVERLNSHLTAQSRGRGEPVLRQIRLNWWANELTALTLACTRPDPLLTEVAASLLDIVTPHSLGELAAAWAMSVDADEPDLIATRGKMVFAILGQILGVANSGDVKAAGAGWALVEEAAQRDPSSAKVDLWSAAQSACAQVRVQGLPRPLGALVGLLRIRAKHRGIYHPMREQGAILRIGLFGR